MYLLSIYIRLVWFDFQVIADNSFWREVTLCLTFGKTPFSSPAGQAVAFVN